MSEKQNPAPVELRKRVMRAIFDPGATEGFKGDRDLTTWQTDAVMRALALAASEGSTDEHKRNSPFVPVPKKGTFVPASDLADILALLDEAQGFAAMSPGGRDNITFAIDRLEDAEEVTYRAGFVDGEKHAHECADMQERRDAQKIEELKQVLKEYVCTCTGSCHAEVYGGTCGRAAYAALNVSADSSEEDYQRNELLKALKEVEAFLAGRLPYNPERQIYEVVVLAIAEAEASNP